MKNFNLLIAGLSILLACSNVNEHKPNETDQTPKSLQDNEESDFMRLSKSSEQNLVEKLYYEQVRKRADLKEIETLLNDNNKIKEKLTDTYRNYKGNNEDYYNAANYTISAIKDSLLKEKIAKAIKVSNDGYNTRIKSLKELMATIDGNDISVNDYHVALKVVITLPQIEIYQKNEMPKGSDYTGFIRIQDSTVNVMKKEIGK